MKRKLPLGIFIAFAVVLFMNCVKDYSYEHTPVAVYTLAGAPDSCTDFIISGTYEHGTPMNKSNTVKLNVNVKETGTFTLKTDTLNGISFSASGTFTQLGVQTVTLTGSGTPDLVDTYTYTPNSGTSICNFSISFENQGPTADYVLESNYGEPHPCTYSVVGNYTAGTTLNTSNGIRIRVYNATNGSYTVSTNTLNGMKFSCTGTFTDVGFHYITLIGTGTPQSAGSFLFTPKIVGPAPLGGATCAAVVDVN